MLAGDFYIIETLEHDNAVIRCDISINADHAIFKGHFPDMPVVPGVCMMQIVKELLETALNCKLQLAKADQMKFLAVINPLETKTLQCALSYSVNENGDIITSAGLQNSTTSFFKFKGRFKND
ncbi:3-hydroxyacyl-ACP dehydratase [Solitalea longa]|uniref:3-hydroxyacyl-ACP dehydratase n=1 Tax=Solitalea longa TaxID=2079460 RepID=A0A2S5A2P4_9SPHI|nr:3-hydroxyacyl-ACP dehydratase [Solitalea longa]POY36552.1 3-hydroxyacyl-ACP dehydratase [Solitalea longa]